MGSGTLDERRNRIREYKLEKNQDVKTTARRTRERKSFVERWWDESRPLHTANRKGKGLLAGPMVRGALIELRRLLRCSSAKLSLFVLGWYGRDIATSGIATPPQRSYISRITGRQPGRPGPRKHYGPGDIAAHLVRIEWIRKRRIKPQAAWMLLLASRHRKAINIFLLDSTGKLDFRDEGKWHDWGLEWFLFPDEPDGCTLARLIGGYAERLRQKLGASARITLHLVAEPAENGSRPTAGVDRAELAAGFPFLKVLHDERTPGADSSWLAITHAMKDFETLERYLSRTLHSSAVEGDPDAAARRHVFGGVPPVPVKLKLRTNTRTPDPAQTAAPGPKV